MIDTYIRLLEYLEEWGIDRLVPVAHLLYKWFEEQPNVDPKEDKGNVSDRIAHFVDEMHESKHIRLEKHKENEDGTGLWIVNARLTSGGLEYLNNYRLVQSTNEANRVQTNRITVQTFVFIAGAAFALGTLGFAALTYINDTKVKDLQYELLRLQVQRKSQRQDSIRMSHPPLKSVHHDTILVKIVKP